MSVEIITKDDLEQFRRQLLNDLKELIGNPSAPVREWLRCRDVKKLLKISDSTLQNLRVTGRLKFSKVGGIHFYRMEDIDKMLM
jgi:hypothetical protein